LSAVESRNVNFLVRPTVDTPFHIDYQWWERADRELDVYLRSHLCPEHQAAYASVNRDTLVDHVDPETAEVTRVPALQHVLITHCSRQPGYLSPRMSLINAVFRVFLASGNAPMTPNELGQKLGRSPQMILRTLSGPRVYKGIRPVRPD
jgi:hypothetical protein